jgi:hypothetical protein
MDVTSLRWLPGTPRTGSEALISPLFCPWMGKVREHIGEVIGATRQVFFIRDDKRGNSVLQAARDPKHAWSPSRAHDMKKVPDDQKPIEIVWEYEWFNAVPTNETAEQMISTFRTNAGVAVGPAGVLANPSDEFAALHIDEVVKPEGPLSIDRYYDTEPLTWADYDARLSNHVGQEWTTCKARAEAAGWRPPSPDEARGYQLHHGSTVRRRHFGDQSQRWHTGAMNIEPFYRRPAPGLGERLEYNFYLHPEGENGIARDLAIVRGEVHPELQAANGFRLAQMQMPGLVLDDLAERVQIAKTRRKFVLREPTTREIRVIINIDRIEADDLGWPAASTVYHDVDVSAEGEVLNESRLQELQRFIHALRRRWGLEPNDRTRYERAVERMRLPSLHG